MSETPSSSAAIPSPLPRPSRERVRPFPPEHKVVLNWLALQPARVFDFAEVAAATSIKPGRCEKIIDDLGHQRWGAPLSHVGPNGERLRRRHAYMPLTSPARAGYPPPPPVPAEVVEHPTITAMKRAAIEERDQRIAAAKEQAERVAERGQVFEEYRARKRAARDKAQADANPKPQDRFVTGYAPPTSAVAAPSAMAPLAPSAKLEEPPVMPKPELKKNTPPKEKK